MRKIKKNNIEDILALTPVQEGMLFHSLKEPEKGYYSEQLCLEISGKIDTGIFEGAWNSVIEINETLRTAFRWEKIEKPTQIILKKSKLNVAVYDLSNKEDSQKKKMLEEIKNKDRRETFDLQHAPFRIILCKIEEAKYELIVSNHHILYDGWSNGVILKEFFRAYNDLCGGVVSVKPVKTKFKEFIKWIQTRDKKKQERYWSEYLEGFEPPSGLPVKKRFEIKERGEVENYSIRLDDETQGKLELFVNSNRITLASVFYSAWGILLQRYCNTEDVLFGVTVSGRNAGIKGIEEMVGLFINTIPSRSRVSGEEKLIDIVLGIERESHGRKEFEHTPLSEIRKHSKLSGVESLFDTLMAVENYPLDNRLNAPNSSLTIESYSIVEKTHYDLVVGIMSAEQITVDFFYYRGMYEKETVESLAGHFKRIVQCIVDNSEEKVSRLEIVSEEEKTRILYDFNNTNAEYPNDKTIHLLFEEQVERTPDHIAVVYRSSEITYGELNKKSNNRAISLQEKGVHLDTIVAIKMERSIEMIIEILGILKAGAAYLPIDPDYPQERIDYMLKDSGAKILLNDELLIACSTQLLNFSTSQLIISFSSASSVAYIIYTSGTTGKPKGALIEHRNVVRLLFNGKFQFDFSHRDTWTMFHSYCFDFSVWEMYGALLYGGKLLVISKMATREPGKFLEILERNRVTVLNQTPSAFYNLSNLEINSPGSRLCVRYVIFGGEALIPSRLKDWKSKYPKTKLINMYGITETTVHVTYKEIEEIDIESNIANIGKPIPTLSVYIMDKNMDLQPIGVPGELVVGGEGVGRGYLNRPGLTNQKFISFVHRLHRLHGNNNPKPKTQNPKLYRSGDLARWLNDGNLEYLGRIDHQVKIRGYRIELGEIEAQLVRRPDVNEAVVVVTESEKGSNYLCAYIVSRRELGVSELREYLGRQLPEYMIPSYFMRIDKIPLTPNGKVDRKALPAPEFIVIEGYVAPRNSIEEKLVKIWSETLGIKKDKIGIDSDFFHLGGHSLKAFMLISQIHKELKIDIPFSEIFINPTIRKLASYIEQKKGSHYREIPHAEEKEYYRLSSSQKRMYLLHRMNPDSIVYNIHGAMSLEGEVDTGKFENVFSKLIERHESLRTSFEIVNDEPVQKIHENVEFAIEYFNSVTEIGLRPFNLSKAPLIRITLIKVGGKKHILVIEMNHIISDGISVQALTRDFSNLYPGKELPEITLQYKDYAEWQDRRKERLWKQAGYWKKEFEGEIPVLELPTDYSRPEIRSFEGSCVDFEISGAIEDALKRVASEIGTTLYMTLLGIYTIFLSKISGQEDIIIGSPVAGRRHPDLENIIGMFVNTLALRIYPYREKTFIDFLNEVKGKTLSALENQDYQYEALVEQLEVNRDIGRNPLFDTMFALQNFGAMELKIPGLKVSPYPNPNDTSKFDLSLNGTEIGERIYFSFEYSVKLFKQETIERFIAYFKNLVRGIIENKDQRISEIEIITGEEKNRILYDFNDTQAEFPKDKTIHLLFEEQVQRTPGNIAVVYSSDQITYRELNQKSDNLAYELIEKGVQSGTIVGIKVERSGEMIIGILGILKSGGAYLPIDPGYPQERIDYILKDSDTQIIVGDRLACSVQSLNFSTSQLLISVSSVRSVRKNILSANSVAYIIYTSGTTGKPKGALIEHRNVVRLLFNEKFQFDFSHEDTWTMFHSYCFDFSVWEMYGALLYGGKLLVIPKIVTRESEKFLETLKRDRVTVLNQTPSAFYNLSDLEISSPGKELCARYVIFGGEALTSSRLKDWKLKYPKTKLIDMYGITETTVHVTYKEMEDIDIASKTSNIGKPIPTLSVYVVGKNLNLQPIGVPGELIVGGEGVGRGYLNRPELTNQKFISFVHRLHRLHGKENIPGQACLSPTLTLKTNTNTFYKTGDLTRWLNDGNLEYLGRIDHQVKIRGFRIELGEIESRLVNHPDIKDAVVLSNVEKSGDRYLCAYIVSNREIPVSELREHLVKTLPDYMIPSHFMQIEKIPLTSNGKIDRNALPEPGIILLNDYEAPQDKLEQTLVEIWSEMLGIEEGKIGTGANFFRIGGHSLKAAIMAAKIHKELNIKISLAEVFNNPTIKALAGVIKGLDRNKFMSIEPVEKKEYYSLSSAQKRLYFVSLMEEKSTVYNIPYAVNMEGVVDIIRIEDVFKKLIDRHESLRTSFEMIEEEPVQRIHNNVELTKVFGSPDPFFQKGVWPPEAIIQSFIRPFNLTEAPLIRVGIIKIEEEKHLMMVDIHHIISDGMSTQVLMGDFSKLYSRKEPTEIKFQYKDYAEWQNRGKEDLRDQEEYWENEFKGEIPVLEIPTDYVRPALQSFEGDRTNFELNRETTDALKALTLETGTTLYMLLLEIYTILLSKLSGQEDIVIGTPVAGRRHADLEKIIGMFVNTLALRNYPSGEKTFTEFLEEVKERTLNAFENQDYQYEELVEQLTVNRDMGRNPLFDTMFTLQNFTEKEIEIPGLKLIPYAHENKTSKFDLALIGMEREGKLVFTIEYCSKLFKHETIERVLTYLKNIVKGVIENKEQRIFEIEIIPEEEKARILYDFNDTQADYPKDKTIHELFRGQAEKTPDYIAIVGAAPCGCPVCLTYKELNERSDSLAQELKEKGVQPGTIVGIMEERTIETIIGIFGILKAGAAYMPIDPDYPQERIDYMLKDSGAKILMNCELSIVNCELLMNPSVSSVSSVAYIIYTSGSTGRPKGVLVEHLPVVNLVFFMKERLKMNERDRTLLILSICFDASVGQIFPTLSSGAVLTLIDKDILLDTLRFEEYVNSRSVTQIGAVPSFFSNMKLRNFPQLKRVMSGGEICPVPLAAKLSGHCDYYNQYGPTETTVTAVDMKVENVDETSTIIPIGKPIANTVTYILDMWKKPVPIGVIGELFIGGNGVARGYLNNPELTNEKFISFVHRLHRLLGKENISKQACLSPTFYKTGDLARWMSNGNIEFLGRIDTQVKIRGYRIELGEIENCLLKHDAVKGAVLAVKEDNGGNKYLSAYIVSDRKIETIGLREYLSTMLPDHMIPSYFVQIEEIPLNPNGKVNVKALPEPGIKAGAEYVAPRNAVEKKLLGIWSDVLGRQTQIGIDDNFFMLGGHSLKVAGLMNRIHNVFSVEIPMSEIFKTPTIRGISQYIEKAAFAIYSSIEPVEKKEYYPMSSAQKRLYVLHQIDDRGTAYNMSAAFEWKGPIDIERLRCAFLKAIHRHESLRTSFEMIDGEPAQRIRDNVDFKIEYFNFLTERTKDTEEKIHQFTHHFNLLKAPLIRAGLIRIEEEKYIMIVEIHHIVSDGVSMEVLSKEFQALYDGKEFPALRVQYKDYTEWRRSPKRQERIEEQEEYWLNVYSDEIPKLDLLTDYPRPTAQSFEGDIYHFKIDTEDSRRFKELNLKNDVTMFMNLLTVLNVLLYKYSGQNDIIIGSDISGRSHGDLDGVVGMFVNMLAIRNHPEGNKTYIQFLNEVKETSLNAFENQEMQFEELVDKLELARDTSHNPLFDIEFMYQTFDVGALEKEGSYLKALEYNSKTSIFDISVEAGESEGAIVITVRYCTKLFKSGTIEAFSRHFANIINRIDETPGMCLSEIDILSESEKRKILYEFNKTKKDLEIQGSYPQLFESQVMRTPDRIAFEYRSEHWTYRYLDEISDRLAAYLYFDKNIRPGDFVGIYLDRSLYFAAAGLAIFKTGGAYVPLDTSLPPERIKIMIEDPGIGAVISEKKYSGALSKWREELPRFHTYHLIDSDTLPSENEKTFPPTLHETDGNNLAYMIYTSGTTGKPKGVMIHHRGMINHLYAKINDLNITEKDIIAQTASVSFDISVWQYWAGLVAGSRVSVVDKETILDHSRFLDLLRHKQVTILETVPSLLKSFLHHLEEEKNRALTDLRWMIPTGESLSVSLAREWLTLYPGIKLVNAYGPTETSDDVTHYILETLPGETQLSIPIGKPLQNIHIYILDKDLSLCPTGVKGEICVSGIGVGKGYWQDPVKTAKSFIPNPYLKEIGDEDYSVVFKTGDVGYYREDGNLECLGRMDYQVKIRGNRIELGEIDSQLLKHEDVDEAVTVVKEDQKGNKYLCAYVTVKMKEKEKIEMRSLKEYLQGELPDYMVPSYFIPMEKLPLSSSGKIDRKALPEPDIEISDSYVAPVDETEKALVRTWSDILGMEEEKIGVNDSFFNLGGHSLKATVLVSKIHKEFNIKMPLVEVFSRQTIRELSKYIRETSKSAHESIEPVEKKEYYELSSAQKRLYILQQIDRESTAYNLPLVINPGQDIEMEKVEAALKKLIARHESLRTSFEIVDGEVVQRIHDDVEFAIEFLATEDTEDTEKKILRFIRSFELTKAPLMRVGLIKLEEGRRILSMDMSHIISDGMSSVILQEDFMAFYSGEVLPELKLQYKDFSEWRNREKEGGALREQGVYWKQEFEGEIPVFVLPTDYSRPVVQSFEGNRVNFEISGETAGALKVLAQETGVTLYMMLLSIFSVFLSKISGHEDMVIGSPVAGRRHVDLGKIIGMFVNTLAIRNNPSGEKRFVDFLQEIKGKTVKALENQDYQYEDLVEQVAVKRDVSRNPLFDIMFVLQNIDLQAKESPGLKADTGEYGNTTSKFDLTLIGVEAEDRLLFTIEYCVKLLKRETIDRFISYFMKIVNEALEDRNRAISEYEIITEEEKIRILYEFNDTDTDYPKDKTIYELFEEQVERAPDYIAIVGAAPCYPSYMTYKELNEKSISLAISLQEKGVQSNSIVGIKIERSIEMMIGIYGILKAGGAYLPIDPGYPQERIDYIIKDSGAEILLNGELSIVNCELLMNPSVSSVAYIIYTSGTTGKPKGAMIEHHSLVNRLNWTQKNYPLDSSDTILQKTTYTFDVSVWEIFWWSMVGSKVCLLVPGGEKDPGIIAQTVERNRVTIMHFVPSMLSLFLEYIKSSGHVNKLSSLKQVIASGEALTVSHVNAFRELLYNEHGVKLANLYGPTEATIDVTYFDCMEGSERETIPIGKPIDNIRLYILDKNLHVHPLGIVGDLYIAGVGLSSGYLNNPELTAEKFIMPSATRNPFEKGVLDLPKLFVNTNTLYKTGDLARWIDDGNIEYLGRIDQQVKIRGFRIELEEIERRLLEHEAVKEVVVICVEDESRKGDGEKSLCACIVSDREIEIIELKEYLGHRLPAHMVPTIYKTLDRIPLTKNGKVDRKALSVQGNRIGGGAKFTAPGTEIEGVIARIWAEALRLDETKVGIHDNFFDLGGASMDVIRVNVRISRELGKEIPLVAFYKYTTIHALSNYLEHGETGTQDLYPEEKREERVQKGKVEKNKMRDIRRKGRRETTGE